MFAAIAVAIKLDSRGPVCFRQSQIGWRGGAFSILKFRTMVDGADGMKAEFHSLNEADGLFKIVDDPGLVRTVAEAMAIGTPVITTTVGGPAELIEHDVNGLLAPPSEPETWSRAICRLLEDPGFASRLAARATIDARARFDPTRIAREVHALHSEIIAGGVRPTTAHGPRPRGRRSQRPQHSRRLRSRSRH